MALIAHYPLNGDLLDYSGNGHILTNNGVVVDNNGKIGKCYNTNAAGYFDIPFTVADQIKGSFTVAIWFKVNSWNTSYAVIMSLTSGGVSWANNMFLLSRNGSSSNLVFAIGDKSTSTTTGCLSGTIDLNKWYHLTCAYEMGKRIKMYINGILVSSYNTTIVPTYSLRDSFRMGRSAGNSYQTDMLLNDARIYNHALSEKEIKELAKAKILHYTFDDFQESTFNEYTYPNFNTSSSSGGWYHWGGKGHIGSYGQNIDPQYIFGNQTYSHWWANAIGATYNYLLYQSPEFDGGYRSLQAIICMEDKSPVTNSKLYPAWNARTGGTLNNNWTSIERIGESYFYLCKCEGILQDGSNDLVGIYIKPGYKAYVSQARLERTQYATPLTIGDYLGVVKDISGHNNHATLALATTPKWTEDSKIGSGAYEFDGIDDYFVSQNNSYLTGDAEFTISYWAYWNENSWVSNYPSGVGVTASGTANGISTTWFSGRPALDFWNCRYRAVDALLIKTWYHVCFTKTKGTIGETSKIYINGESVSGALEGSNLIPNITNAPFVVGRLDTTRYFNGSIDDVRIYATALTADDIKELYQTRMSLDSGGNLSVVAIVEQEDKVALSSKGILSLDNFSEVGITDGLVAWYPLDGNAEDRSGNQNHGTVYGATVAQGIDGLCYEFDRNLETYINCGNSNEININGAPTISISFWMNANSFSDVASIIFKNSHYSIAFYKNGETNGKITYADSSNWSFSSFGFMGDFNRNQWYFITMVKDVNSLVTFFVDGEILESKSFGGNLSLRTNDLHIGRYTGYLSFDGKIDDVRIYNRALSSDEIGILYDLGLSKTKLKMTDSTVYLKGQLKEV